MWIVFKSKKITKAKEIKRLKRVNDLSNENYLDVQSIWLASWSHSRKIHQNQPAATEAVTEMIECRT